MLFRLLVDRLNGSAEMSLNSELGARVAVFAADEIVIVHVMTRAVRR